MGYGKKDLAIALGVNKMTIVSRELDRRKPMKRHIERFDLPALSSTAKPDTVSV